MFRSILYIYFLKIRSVKKKLSTWKRFGLKFYYFFLCICVCVSISFSNFITTRHPMISLIFSLSFPCRHVCVCMLYIYKKYTNTHTLIPKSCQLTLAKVSIKKAIFIILYTNTIDIRDRTLSQLPFMLLYRVVVCHTFYFFFVDSDVHQHSCYIIIFLVGMQFVCCCENGNKIYQFPYFSFFFHFMCLCT